jgi:hypothetical protein
VTPKERELLLSCVRALYRNGDLGGRPMRLADEIEAEAQADRPLYPLGSCLSCGIANYKSLGHTDSCPVGRAKNWADAIARDFPQGDVKE